MEKLFCLDKAVRKFVAGAVVDWEEFAGLMPPGANAEVDVAEATLGGENCQRPNLVGDTATGNEVERHKKRGTYIALRYLHRGGVDRGSENSTGDGEELSGEHSC